MTEPDVGLSIVEKDEILKAIERLEARIAALDDNIRGDGQKELGINGRLTQVEDWMKSKQAIERTAVGALVTMALTALAAVGIWLARMMGSTRT